MSESFLMDAVVHMVRHQSTNVDFLQRYLPELESLEDEDFEDVFSKLGQVIEAVILYGNWLPSEQTKIIEMQCELLHYVLDEKLLPARLSDEPCLTVFK